jgi:hypothetical protein
MIEHLLERGIHALRLADLLDGAAVVARVRRGSVLRAQDERLQRGDVGEPAVVLRMTEDQVEQLERRPGREEVLHVRVPRAVEAGDERETDVVVTPTAAKGPARA